MRISTSLALVGVFLAPAAKAQEYRPLELGERVRITHGCTERRAPTACRVDRGVFGGWREDSLVVVVDGTSLALPRLAVTRIEAVRGSRRNVGKGAWIGALVGGTAGAVTGALICSDNCDEVTPAGGALIFGGIGGAGGAVLGMAIGTIIRSARWVEVRVDRGLVSFGVLPSGLMLSVQRP